jgi:hypothetical protein
MPCPGHSRVLPDEGCSPTIEVLGTLFRTAILFEFCDPISVSNYFERLPITQTRKKLDKQEMLAGHGAPRKATWTQEALQQLRRDRSGRISHCPFPVCEEVLLACDASVALLSTRP